MNSKKIRKKCIIDKYTQPIYIPNNIYVCKNYTKKDLDKLFEFTDHSSIYLEDDSNIASVCYGVVDKKNDIQCIVVLLNISYGKEYKEINTIAHEAFHVAYRLLETCGAPLDDSTNECYAYLVGWAAECIYKTAIK